MAAGEARRIRKDDLPPARPYADLIDAGLAFLRGDPQAAAGALSRAVSGFDLAKMSLYREAARYRLGRLRGGDDGAQLEQQSLRFMAEQGIRNPARMVAMLAPACGPDE